MAEAVAEALTKRRHLLAQAGTGTGKSLAYLVPALLHEDRVVVATATLALQHQLVERDIPALLEAAADVLDEQPSYAVLKGRSNYACLHRVREGVPDDQGTLVEVPDGTIGSEVVTLRAWAEQEASAGGPGDKDSAPRHTDRAWRAVSVNHRECLGALRCPFAGECFAEAAKEKAHQSDLIVTNHSLLAIDAIEGVPMIPDYESVIIDEAHELVARITQAATDELSVSEVDRAARRAARYMKDDDSDPAGRLGEAADALRDAIAATAPGRIDMMSEQLAEALALVRDSARAVVSAFPKDTNSTDPDAAAQQARGAVQELLKVAERMAAGSEADVLWVAERDSNRGGNQLCIAPLEVRGPLRDKLLADKTVVFTSATLKLGGDFAPVAASFGLGDPDGSPQWRGIDVGSPFDYGKQAILYVAAHLPRPGRDGITDQVVDEIVGLVDAAQGRTLGLFSSRRAAETAAELVRERLPHLTILAQGDAQLPELRRQFVEDPHTCLFGTLGLWQGLDVPGDTCQLVIIDRIPFPRPDDPLMSARQRAADKEGRNGFMSVAATHAALLLAQGAGRLIRTTTDRGVVALLDERVASARYGSFLTASLPPMWRTTDRTVVLKALQRLATGR
ncbi:MAG: ATP-dependent DNA helicase [Nocardioidaceae bacterium]